MADGKIAILVICAVVFIIFIIAFTTGDTTNVLFVPNVSYINVWNVTEDGFVIDLITPEWYVPVMGLNISTQKDMNLSYGEIITVLESAVYKVDWSVSFAGQAGATYSWGIAVNDSINKTRECYAQRSTTGEQIGNIGGTCILNLSIFSTLAIMVDDESNPVKDPTIYAISISVHEID